MAELVDTGRLRAAGASNFEPAHIHRLIAETGILPVVNQIELHTYFRNSATRAWSKKHGIAVEVWGPLGQGQVLGDPTIAGMSRCP